MTSTRKSRVVSCGDGGPGDREVRSPPTPGGPRHPGNRGAAVTVRRNRFAGGSLAALLALVLSLAGAAGCDLRETGNGVYAERPLHVADFEGVRVQDGIDAVITVAPGPQTVTLTGDENLLDYNIKAAVEPEAVGSATASVLHVWASPSIVPVIPPRVVVSRPALSVARASAGSAIELSSPPGAATAPGPLAVGLDAGTLTARDYPVDGAAVDLAAGSTAILHSDGPVTGRVSADSHLDNTAGLGPCVVTTTAGADVRCAASP